MLYYILFIFLCHILYYNLIYIIYYIVLFYTIPAASRGRLSGCRSGDMGLGSGASNFQKAGDGYFLDFQTEIYSICWTSFLDFLDLLASMRRRQAAVLDLRPSVCMCLVFCFTTLPGSAKGVLLLASHQATGIACIGHVSNIYSLMHKPNGIQTTL